MEIDSITLKMILSKLSRPVHISYIARYIVKNEIDITRKIMDHLVELKLIEESQLGKEYYVRSGS